MRRFPINKVFVIRRGPENIAEVRAIVQETGAKDSERCIDCPKASRKTRSKERAKWLVEICSRRALSAFHSNGLQLDIWGKPPGNL